MAKNKYLIDKYWMDLYGKLLKIVWLDSVSFLNPNILYINRLMTVESTGWLVEFNEKAITIASFRDNDPVYHNDRYFDQYHNFTVISMHAIKKVRVI